MPNDPYKIIPGKPLNTPEFRKAQDIIDTADAGIRATKFVDAVDQIQKFEADKAKLEQSVSSGITDILATKAAIDVAPAPSFGDLITAGAELDNMGGLGGTPESVLKKKKDLADFTKDPDIVRAATIYKDKIQNGTPSEIYKAINDLRSSYSAANYNLSKDDRAGFTKSYQDLVNYGKSVAMYKYAQDNVNKWMSEGSALPKNVTPKGLKSQKTTDKEILDMVAGFDGLNIGSKLYNNADLQVFRNTSDQELRSTTGSRALIAGLETQYNRAVSDVLRDKSGELSQKLNGLNNEIKRASTDEQRQALINQRIQVQQAAANIEGLSKKMSLFANEDNFLKANYKDLYEEKQNLKRREYYKNEVDPNETVIFGENSDPGEFFSRTAEMVGANLARTWSGLQSLTGFEKSAFFTGLAADRLAPLSYRMGKDLNKNYQIDESELTRDINGNIVTHDMPVYTDASGERQWSGEAIFEQVLPIVTDIAVTTLVSRATGGLARLAPMGALRWSNIGKTVGLTAEGMNAVRPYVSTFGSVTASTFPRFYAEERRNFKEGGAAGTAFLRAAAEGLTESILPDTDLFLGSRGSVGLLDNAFKRGAGYVGGKVDDLTGGSLGRLNTKLTAQTDLMLSMLPKGMVDRKVMAALLAPGLRKTLSAGTQESIEEVGSLVANYFIDKYAATQNFEYEQNNELTWGSVWETFVTSLGPSAIIGAGTAFGRRSMKEAKDSDGNTIRNSDGTIKYVTDWSTSALAHERANTARWNVANNPEIYKKLISQKKESGEYTAEEAIRQTAVVERMSQKLNEMLPSIKSIKNLNTMLDDPNTMVEYFNDKMFAEELLNVNIDELSDEDRKAYEASVNNTANKLQKTERIIDQYSNMTEIEKRAVIKKLYDDKVAEAQSDSFMLDPTDLERRKKDERFQFIADLNDRYQGALVNTLARRVANFKDTLLNNPENLTVRELLTMAEVFAPALDKLEQANMEVPFSPLAQTQQNAELTNIPGPQPLFAAPELAQLIRNELANRSTLTELQAIEQGAMNLNIPDVKREQEFDMALAELSEDELSKGFIEEDAHPEWSPAVRAVITGMLEAHMAEKTNTGNETSLEKKRKATLTNFYGVTLKETDPSAKIAQINKAIREKAALTPARQDFGGRRQPAPVPQRDDNFRGLAAVNPIVFDEFTGYRNSFEAIIRNTDLDESTIKEETAAFSVAVVQVLSGLTTFEDLYSALSGLYPSANLAFSKFFQEAAEGNFDVSTIDGLGLSPSMVSRIFYLAKVATVALTPYQKVENYIQSFYAIESIEELEAFDNAVHPEDPDRRLINNKMVRAKRKEIQTRLSFDMKKNQGFTSTKVGNKTYLFQIIPQPNNKKELRIVDPNTGKSLKRGKVVDTIVSQLITSGQLFDSHDFRYAMTESESIRYVTEDAQIDFLIDQFLGQIGGVYLNKASLDMLASADRPTAFNFSPYTSNKRKDGGMSVMSLEDLASNAELLDSAGLTIDDIVDFLQRHKTQKYVSRVGKAVADRIIKNEVIDGFGVSISDDVVRQLVSAYTSRFTVDPVSNATIDLNNLPFELRNDLVEVMRERNRGTMFEELIPSTDSALNFYDPIMLGMIGDVLDTPAFRNTLDPQYLQYLDEFYEDATNTIYPLNTYEDISGLFSEETTDVSTDQEIENPYDEVIDAAQKTFQVQVDNDYQISLSIIDTDIFDESLLGDPAVSFAYRVLHQYRETGMVGQDYNVLVGSMMDIYKLVLNAEDYQYLVNVKNSPKGTPVDGARIRQILSTEGLPMHNKGFFNYIITNPSTIGSGLGSVFVDSDKQILKFNQAGVVSSEGSPLISTLKKKTPAELALREKITSSPGQILFTKVVGLRSGKEAVVDASKTVGTIVLNTDESNRVITSAFGEYTLFKGGVYIQNNDSVYPFQAVILPSAPDGFVSALVDAFNNGTLPAGLPTELSENPKAFVEYVNALLYLSPKNNGGLILGTNSKGKITYKAKNKAGKYQHITGKPEVQAKRVAEAFTNIRYNVNKDNLDLNGPFSLIKMLGNQLAVIPFNTYEGMLKSDEFGAKVSTTVNQTFALDSEYTIHTEDTLLPEQAGVEVTVHPTADTVSTQPTDAVADIERRRQEELAEFDVFVKREDGRRQKPLSKDFIEDTISKVNAKYDAELAALSDVDDLDDDIDYDSIFGDIAPDDVLERSLLLQNTISEQENNAAQVWVENSPIFKGTRFIFDKTIAHPTAYAVWSKAGVFLFEGANYAEGYHEAWHEFSQYYLTKEQKDSLYAQARKIYGDLSLVELEEKLAEDFRQFALSNGKVFPEGIKANKEAKSVFQKIWDFITNFVSDKKTVDFYFGQLYKGQISSYTRNEDQAYFKELNSSKLVVNLADGTKKAFSFKEGDEILNQFDSLFVSMANRLVSQLNGSVVNVLDNKAYIVRTYKAVDGALQLAQAKYNQLVAENPTPLRVARKEYLDMLVGNRQTLFLFHKTASTLFSDKVKQALNEEVVDATLMDDMPAFGQFESAVNEQSQKLKAAPLIITAIKSLPQYKNNLPVKDKVFGVNKIGDFDTNWNILQRTLSGTNSYADMYRRIQDLTTRYGQFRQLLSYLPKPSETDVKQSTLNFKNAFFNTFSMPYIDGYTNEITTTTEKDGQTKVTHAIYKAQSLDSKNLRRAWDNDFYVTDGFYKSIDGETGSYYLNADKYFEDYPTVPDEPIFTSEEDKLNYQESLYAMLTPLGFNFSEFGKEALFTMPVKDFRRQVERIHKKIISLSETQRYIFTPLTSISSEHINSEDEVVFSEQTALLELIQFEVQANVEYVNDMQYNALGKKVWSVNPHTYMTRVLSIMNDSTLYPTLDDVYRELPQLDPAKNPAASFSAVIKYMFTPAGNRRLNPDNSTRTLDIANLLGVKEGFDGEKTIDVVTPVKHYTDVMGLLASGVEEVNRFSGKSTTRGLVLDDRFRYELGMKSAFTYNNSLVIPDAVFANSILPILFGEIYTTLNPSSKFRVSVMENETTPILSYFQQILEPAVRAQLFASFKEESNLANYTLVYDKLPTDLKNKVIKQFSAYIYDNIQASNAFFQGVYSVPFEDLAKYHVLSFISRVEQHKLFYGHPYYYKNDKEIEKRISAWNAYGSYAVIDQQNLESVKDAYTQRDAFLHHNSKSNAPVDVATGMSRDLSKISYIVLKDTAVSSDTANNSDAYNKVGGTKNGKKVTLKQYYNDKDSKRHDAAAFCTMDFYKRFYKLSTGVSEAMRKEFDRQDRIYALLLQKQSGVDNQEELDKVLNEGPYYAFNIKKLQYAGHAAIESGESIPVFHKYSVKPILPSELVTSPELAQILAKMHASGADYAVVSSGTKIAETIEPVNLFNEDGSVDTNFVPTGSIDMRYLKEQVLVENKETFMSIFSTQFRKLAYKDSEKSELYEAYRKYIDELVSLDKISFVSKLEDQEKLVEYLLKELSKKNVAEATKDLIKLKENGELQHTLDAMIDRTVMESAIVASVTNDILKQKVPGAQRVQYPASLIRPGRKLGYYDLVTNAENKKVIKQAEAMISFSKGYYPLLNLMYNGQTIGEFDAKGKPVNMSSAVRRLNEALTNPIFVEANSAILDKALTIAAIRVPGQDYNSMESFRVVEFLPEESGEIILVPDEMVIKSGSDYDIDKLFCYDPFIELDGSVLTNNITPQQAFEAREAAKQELEAIRETKKSLSKGINAIRKRIQEVVTIAGFDASNTRLKDLYKMYTDFNAEQEEEDRPISQEDVARLANFFKEPYETKKKKATTEIKKILTALRTANNEGLSDSLFALNEELSALLERERFLTHEVKAIRGRFSNNLLFNLAERLTDESLFTLLLRPNSSDTVTEMAKLFGESNKYTTASYTNIVNPLYQLYVHQLNAFKKSLGVDAKSNVLHAILQKAGLVVIDKQAVEDYPLDANGKSTGFLDFSSNFDVEYNKTKGKKGTRIGDISGQLITAHVDIERDDNIAKIFLNNKLTPTANYMNMLGSRFEDIVKMINLSYKNVDGVKKDSSIIRYARGSAKYLSKRDFVQAILNEKLDKAFAWSKKTGEPLPEYAQFLNASLNQFGTEIMVNALKKRLNAYRISNPDALLSDQTEMGDLLRFVGWIATEEQQDKLFILSSNTDFDTFTPQNFESFRKGGQELADLMKSNFFNKKGVQNVIFESVVSPFQLQQDIFDKLETIFPVSANKTLTSLIIRLHRSMKALNYRLDYDTFSRVFKNDLLYSLFRNNVPQVAEYEKLLDKRNLGHISTLYNNLKVRLGQRGIQSDNLIFDGVVFTTNEDSQFIRAGYVQSEIDYSVDMLREDFSNGFNWSHPSLDPTNEDDQRLIQDMQSFFKAYAYAGIIGTNLNKRYDSYLPLIPEQVYTLPMSSIISEFTVGLAENIKTITDALVADYNAKENKELSDVLKETMTTTSEERGTVINNVLSEQMDTLLDSLGDSHIAKFVRRFKEVHPEFSRTKDPNIDLFYFKDYDLTRESITPSSKVLQSSLTTRNDNPNREYTPKEVLELQPNEVFVFGANTLGHHGSGSAGYAQYKNGKANYNVLEPGTKGYWSEYGVTDRIMQGTNGMSYGVVTKFASMKNGKLKIGAKNSIPLSAVEESVVGMLKTAADNPNLKFLVTAIGVKQAGWNTPQIRSIFAKHNAIIPDNVILPKIFEVRDSIVPTTTTDESGNIVPLVPENFEAIKRDAIKDTFQELADISNNHENFCGGA
jgi:hypothetical protein